MRKNWNGSRAGVDGPVTIGTNRHGKTGFPSDRRPIPFGMDDLLDCDGVGIGSQKPNNRGYFNSPETVWGEIRKNRNLGLDNHTAGRSQSVFARLKPKGGGAEAGGWRDYLRIPAPSRSPSDEASCRPRQRPFAQPRGRSRSAGRCRSEGP